MELRNDKPLEYNLMPIIKAVIKYPELAEQLDELRFEIESLGMFKK